MASDGCGLQRYCSEPCDQLRNSWNLYGAYLSCDDQEAFLAAASDRVCKGGSFYNTAERLVSGSISGLYETGICFAGSGHAGTFPGKWNIPEPAAGHFPGRNRKLCERGRGAGTDSRNVLCAGRRNPCGSDALPVLPYEEYGNTGKARFRKSEIFVWPLAYLRCL